MDALKQNLKAAAEKRRVAFLVLDETLKSAKHARKALDAREKAVKKAEKPTVKKGVRLADTQESQKKG